MASVRNTLTQSSPIVVTSHYSEGMTLLRNTLLRDARRKRLWKQQQLADFAVISLSTVQRAERGEEISLECIERLCTALDKTPEQLGFDCQLGFDPPQLAHSAATSETKHVDTRELSFFVHLVNQLGQGEIQTIMFWSLAGRHCPHLLEAVSCQFQGDWSQILFTRPIADGVDADARSAGVQL